MTLPRFIPRYVFQAIAVLSLMATVAVSVQLCLEGLPPWSWLSGLGPLLASVLTVALSVLAWALCLLPLRRMSWMPTVQEELAAAGVETMDALYAQQRRQLEADRRRNNVRWHWMMCIGGGLLGGGLSVPVAVFWFDDGRLLAGPTVMVGLCVVLVVWHLAQVVLRLVQPRAAEGTD